MSDASAALVADAEQRLAEAKRALKDEIARYPSPISGCDAQFNHLLAERQRVDDALRALQAEIHIPTPRAP